MLARRALTPIIARTNLSALCPRPPSFFGTRSRPFSSSTSNDASSSAAQQDTVTKGRRKRHRHRFNTISEDIPSFQEFQQQQQIRSLYRKFTRLVFQKASSTGKDLQSQIRREFRLPQQDSWHIKRSVSEGNRRYKELSAMLGTSVKPNDQPTTSAPASATGNWPWNNKSSTNNSGDRPQRPLPFPPKSNL